MLDREIKGKKNTSDKDDKEVSKQGTEAMEANKERKWTRNPKV